MPLGFVHNETQYLYLTNISGDVIGIADNQGNIVARYSYNEWGKLNSIVDNNGMPITDTNSIAIINPLRYRGYYYDNETGYYYLQSRYYDPEICRFINADLPEYSQIQKDGQAGINLFAYCENDPVNNSDINGNKKIPNWVKIAIGTAGIVAAVIAAVTTGGAAIPALIAALKTVVGSMAVSMAIGGVIGYIVGGKEGLKQGLIDGAIDGYAWGGAISAVSAISKAVKIAKTGQYVSSACFVAGTPILSIDGFMPIEKVNIGDLVLSYNPNTQESEYKTVKRIFSTETNTIVRLTIDGEEIITTNNHPFLKCDGCWIAASKLVTGDRLISRDNTEVVVNSVVIENLNEKITVYNFEVEDFHTYFVGYSTVVVHNKCGIKNIRTLQETKIGAYSKVSMDVERGGSGLVNIHIHVNKTKYFYDGMKKGFFTKGGAALPKVIQNSQKVKKALEKALEYSINGRL